MTPTYRPLAQRAALSVNQNADLIATLALGAGVILGAVLFLVFHPAFYLV
jgi:hypothetical protein